jgi:catechol 2,3-dioxygenase-like lactoylglutathione lyase family enzyme
MANKITHTQVYVLDQDEALDFYVGKLGFEVNTDADLGFMRWLTVNFPGQPDQQLLLEKPGPPAHDEATAEQIRELVTKGALGMAAIIAVDDIHKTYKELVDKGVEFTEEPTERFYGTDCGLRDPFGNPIRMGTPKEGPIEIPEPGVRRRLAAGALHPRLVARATAVEVHPPNRHVRVAVDHVMADDAARPGHLHH